MEWPTVGLDALVRLSLVLAALALAATVVAGCALEYDVGRGSVQLQRDALKPSASSSINSQPIQPVSSPTQPAK